MRGIRKRKKFYFHTIAWVLVVAAICAVTAYNLKPPPRIRSIKVIMFSEEYMARFQGSFPPARQYTGIHLTGDAIKDRINLDFARIRVHEILQEMDTVNGVHFHFGKGAQFQTLIRTMDLLRQERAQHYIQDSEGIRFFYEWEE